MARARSIGNVYAELSVKDKMTAGLKRANTSIKSFGASAAKAGAVAAAAGAMIGAAMAAGAKKALDLGGRLSDVSAQTGIAVADVMKLERAYVDGGLAASGMGKDVARMQKVIANVASGRATENPFEALGLSAEKLLAMRPADQFDAIGNAIKKIENPTLRNAAAMEIFGKSGAKLMTVFGQVAGASEALGRMPEVAQRFANSFDRASDIIGGLPQKSDQFFVGFTSGIIGQLLPGLEKANKMDFTELGEKLGDAISTGLELITSGDIWEVFRLNAEKAMTQISSGQAMNEFNAVIAAVWEGFQPEGGGDYDFIEAFDKYKNAGDVVNAERAATIQAEIDEIMARSALRSKAKKDAAAVDMPAMDGVMTRDVIPSFIEAMEGIPALLQRPAGWKPPNAKDDQDFRSFDSVSAEVNEMQSRGLGMGSMSVPKEVKDQVSLLTQIRDVLKKASTRGKLVWD